MRCVAALASGQDSGNGHFMLSLPFCLQQSANCVAMAVRVRQSGYTASQRMEARAGVMRCRMMTIDAVQKHAQPSRSLQRG